MSQPRHELDRAEYVEQAYLYQLLRERTGEQMPMQELLGQVHYELLATTRLPMALEYLLTELKALRPNVSGDVQTGPLLHALSVLPGRAG